MLELGDCLLPMPADLLHITLFEIIQPKPYKHDKEQLYRDHGHQYERALDELFASAPSISLHFSSLEVSPQAIIVRADDPGLNPLRSNLSSLLTLPYETRTPPDITHCTIARFNEQRDLKAIQEVTSKLTIEVTETISTFQLVHNLNPPRLGYEVLHTYHLA